ncbi:MAG: hypothetical protein Q9227_004670 [Pyrenula ochraceoflavens]
MDTEQAASMNARLKRKNQETSVTDRCRPNKIPRLLRGSSNTDGQPARPRRLRGGGITTRSGKKTADDVSSKPAASKESKKSSNAQLKNAKQNDTTSKTSSGKPNNRKRGQRKSSKDKALHSEISSPKTDTRKVRSRNSSEPAQSRKSSKTHSKNNSPVPRPDETNAESSLPYKETSPSRSARGNSAESFGQDQHGTPFFIPEERHHWGHGQEELGPKGIVKPGATCYQISFLQLLFNIPVVANFVEDFHKTSACSQASENACMRCALKKLFRKYRNRAGDESQSLENPFQEFQITVQKLWTPNAPQDKLDVTEQQDAPEFAHWLINKIYEELLDHK